VVSPAQAILQTLVIPSAGEGPHRWSLVTPSRSVSIPVFVRSFIALAIPDARYESAAWRDGRCPVPNLTPGFVRTLSSVQVERYCKCLSSRAQARDLTDGRWLLQLDRCQSCLREILHRLRDSG